ncbi:PDC sensor domain-containing protein [Sedimenticola sp.]|uniref:PDC sensor domain-containing protein n=1 Tax=Sedimenticola sp. TaxID=1940285 RepID=UPI003D14BC21
MNSPIQKSISRQRHALGKLIRPILGRIAGLCSEVWPDRQGLNEVLASQVSELPYCAYIYALGTDAIQISDNINGSGRFPEHFGRDRSSRPYLNSVYPAVDYHLSEAYISLLSGRPSITAIQLVRRGRQVIGLLGADFDLRDLPLTQQLYDEPDQWRQMKGDPSIRGLLFQQTRVKSVLDAHIDEVMSIMEELMAQRGVFHGKLHFSSSRATLWLADDPYRYRILEVEELIDPDICLAYPVRPYPPSAMLPQDKIKPILDGFKKLRLADETVYLRSGSINIFNGLVGLNFSCDGSHYIPWSDFLNPGNAFWSGDIGSTNRPATAT